MYMPKYLKGTYIQGVSCKVCNRAQSDSMVNYKQKTMSDIFGLGAPNSSYTDLHKYIVTSLVF